MLVNKNINSTLFLVNKISVKQKDVMGCGVACVAFVLNIKYQKALKLFKNPQKEVDKGFDCKEIVKALKKRNLDFKYKYIKGAKIRRTIYKNNSIVYIERSNKYPMGHYLCRWNNKWMDPWINFPNQSIKTDFRKRLPQKPIYVIFKSNKIGSNQ